MTGAEPGRNSMRVLFMAVVLTVLAGCGDSGSGSADWGPYYLRVMNVSSDAPAVAFVTERGLPLFSDVVYKATTGWTWQPASGSDGGRAEGIYEIQGQLAEGDNITLSAIDASQFQIENEYTIIATGPAEDLVTIVAPNPRQLTALSENSMQISHAAPSHGLIDVYVTVPDALLADSVPFAQLKFAGFTKYKTLTEVDYRIRITRRNDDEILFDSGILRLASPGNPDNPDDDFFHQWHLAVIDNVELGAWPFRMILTDGFISTDIVGSETPAAIRLIHAAPSEGEVDVFINEDFDNPLASGLPYLDPSAHGAIEPGEVNLVVTEAGNPDNVLFSDPFGFDPTSILLENDGCYNFNLDVASAFTPFLTISEVGDECGVESDLDPTEAYGVEFFVRGSFNDDADPPSSLTRFENLGNDFYQAEFELLGSDEAMTFRVASADRDTVDFSTGSLMTLDFGRSMFADSTASAGFAYSVALVDTVDGLDGIRMTDIQRGVVTEAKVRFIQAFNIGTDIANLYLTTTPDEELGPENRYWLSTTPTLTTPYLTLAPGTRYVTLATRTTTTPVADDTVVFGPVPMDMQGGNVLSVLIADPARGEDELVIIDDLMP
jgi:hypothetical protein